jgi:4-amino-4-deoxy-L-arabinose transferase-like glycosyltransferase
MRMRSHRLVHYLVLAAVHAVLTLPNLGAHSLWDMDEGVNAECTREMMESGSWIVPTFNWELRTAKPILMYWAQRLSFESFGVDEWSARFPSVLFGLGTVLLTYELGRRMYGWATGLLGAIALASAIQFCVLSHASTPDAPLIFFTVLTFYFFWRFHEDQSAAWWIPTAVACGFAVLTKGPIGVGLPAVVVLLYFAWNREWGRMLSWRILPAAVVFLLVAAPWYILVTAETKGEYLGRFLTHDNMNRFVNPMDKHDGPIFYHAAALLVLFAPWSSLIGATLWYAVASARANGPTGGLTTETRAARFLLCWFVTYLVFFSIAATKLPNYIAPLYPAIALLTARFLVRWQSGELKPARWVMPLGVAGVALTGLLLGAGMIAASGAFGSFAGGMRLFPGLEKWAWVGLIPLIAAAVMAWKLKAQNRTAVVAALTTAAVALVGVVAAGPVLVIDEQKAAKTLVRETGVDRPDREIRLYAMDYFQESLVFYAGRRVEKVFDPRLLDGLLTTPLPVYLFVPEGTWANAARDHVTVPYRVIARKYDFYRNAVIVVVTNAYLPGHARGLALGPPAPVGAN